MLLSKSKRGTVACLAAVLVLLCQSTALAHAYAGNAAQAAAAVAYAPCHDAGENEVEVPVRDDHPPRCLSQIASLSPTSLDAPVVPGLPLIVARADRFAIDRAAAPAVEPRLARNESPPLTILHCCLRN